MEGQQREVNREVRVNPRANGGVTTFARSFQVSSFAGRLMRIFFPNAQ